MRQWDEMRIYWILYDVKDVSKIIYIVFWQYDSMILLLLFVLMQIQHIRHDMQIKRIEISFNVDFYMIWKLVWEKFAKLKSIL